MTHFLRRTFFLFALFANAVAARASAGYAESPVFAFDTRDVTALNVAESAAFIFNTWDDTTQLAAQSATFAFDTRAIDGLMGSADSGTFFIDTRGTVAMPALQIVGTVRDSAGAALAGATVQLKRYETAFWQETSAAGGAFTTPQLSAANYKVIVTKTGYVTSITSLSGTSSGTYPLEIRLTPMPPVAATQTVVRTPQATAMRSGPDQSDPAYPVLERFNGTHLVYDLTGLVPSRMTVVITPGWVPLIGGDYTTALDWAAALAALIYQHHPGLADPPNILVWDWRHKANTYLPQVDDAAEEGIELGKARQDALGATYSQHIHFIGHSLGAIVNCYACDYVHGELPRASQNPATHWFAAITKPHITLLDEAELATIGGRKVITSGMTAWQAALSKGGLIDARAAIVAGAVAAVVAGTETVVQDWKNVVSKSAINSGWIDNYISAFGRQRPEAVNVCLVAPTLAFDAHAFLLNPFGVLADAHGYSHLWYRNTVAPSGAPSALGFSVAAENGAIFPPNGTGRTAGSLWYENIDTANIVDVTQTKPQMGVLSSKFDGDYPMFFPVAVLGGLQLADALVTQPLNAVVIQPLDAVGRSVLDGSDATIQWVGDIGGTVIYKTGQVVTSTKQKLGLWWDAANDFATDVLNSTDPETQNIGQLGAGVLQVILKKQPAVAQGGLGAAGRGLAASGGVPAYAWFTVQVPTEAAMMAFDFTVTGDPSEDRIACAINEQNLFTLPAKFAPDGSPVSTDMMDVSAYAGQTVELFFGLAGGTSTDCEVAIDGIRFITIPKPKMAMTRVGVNVQVKWPAAASGWVMESSTTLAPGSWQAEPLTTGVTAESGVLTLEQTPTSAKKFYRLRRTP